MGELTAVVKNLAMSELASAHAYANGPVEMTGAVQLYVADHADGLLLEP